MSRIYNPGQQRPDLVLAMNTPSFKKFVTMVKPGGTILVNADMMTEDTNVRDGMNDMFRKKGKSKFEAKNSAAFEAG